MSSDSADELESFDKACMNTFRWFLMIRGTNSESSAPYGKENIIILAVWVGRNGISSAEKSSSECRLVMSLHRIEG